VRVRAKKTKTRKVIVNIAEVSGLNSVNCQLRVTLARRAQRPPCAARARVTVLKSRSPAKPKRVRKPPKRVLKTPKPPFTG
jgi:hypothetical protein